MTSLRNQLITCRFVNVNNDPRVYFFNVYKILVAAYSLYLILVSLHSYAGQHVI